MQIVKYLRSSSWDLGAKSLEHEVRIGQRVKFRVHAAEGDEPPYPVFTPAGGKP